MGRKPPQLETKLCPICGNKAALDTARAHLAFHSKYYVKLRNSAKNFPSRKGPQVGRIGTIEEAMLDNSFAKFLKSIRPADSYQDDELLWKVIPWLIGLTVLILLFLGIDSTVVELTMFGVIAIMFWIEFKQDDSFFKNYLKRLHLVDVQWLCLKCNHHWVETKTRPMKWHR